MTNRRDLLPEYNEQWIQVVRSIYRTLPEPMKAQYSDTANSVISLLIHFAKEYMLACQNANTSILAGVTMPSPIPTDARSSAERFIQGVKYGYRFGIEYYVPEYCSIDISHAALDGTQPPDSYGGIDFHSFGNNFLRPVMDFTSVDVNVFDSVSKLQQIQTQLDRGENVIIFSNHQCEADPHVVNACFELAGFANIAKQMIFAMGHMGKDAGADSMEKILLMGLNLIFIDPEIHSGSMRHLQIKKVEAKSALLSALREDYGVIIWAASGGDRDSRIPETNMVPIAPFDVKTIEMFRLMGSRNATKLTHFYTMAMVSYPLCPLPYYVTTGLGQTRNVRFSPVGIAIGNELDTLESGQSFCIKAQQQCEADYQILLQSLVKR
jgi:glycerol-3-phosphate O-acyltransferase